MTSLPIITVAVPSYNQASFLESALTSIFEQDLPLEVYVADGGSSDGSVDIIRRHEGRLAHWRSRPDAGQASAINECIAKGSAPFVCWLNGDDQFLEGGLKVLLEGLLRHSAAPAVYGRVWNDAGETSTRKPVWVEPFSRDRLAKRCIVSQPGTLIRRSAWEAVHGLDERMYMAMDYDLWWRLFQAFAPLVYLDAFVAINRDHPGTKTNRLRRQHYREAMAVVRKYNGRVPLRWWLAQPYSVWLRSIMNWRANRYMF